MNRNVLIAAVVSVGAHAALILPLISWKVSAPVAVPAAAGAELIHVDVLPRAKPQSTPSPQKGEGARRAGGASRPSPAVLEKPVTTALLDGPSPAPPAPEAEESSSSPSPPSPSPTAAVAAPAADPSVERELHQRLQSNAVRCYPNASRRFHEQGTTEVSFCVGDTGQLAEGKLARSSGSERLDRAALDCVIAGSDPFPAAHGRCFALPVKFGD